ncbi:MAG: enoyl-CoA hydratase/isomerase family protein [Thermodesulfobacteriota bacterium]
MSSERPAIRLDREERVVTLTLDRPETLNAYDTTMRDEIFAALEWLHAETDVGVLVVRGNGRAFSSGGDLREFGTAPSPVRAREVRRLRDVWRLWSTLPCVSLAAVHGYAVGGGLEMALLCDLVVCTTDARFALPETALGLVPGVGGTQTLPRAIGLGRAADVLLAGGWIDGREAARSGLALQAVAPSRLLPTARALARRLASIEPSLVRAAKQCVRRGLDLPLAAGIRLERRIGSALGPSER